LEWGFEQWYVGDKCMYSRSTEVTKGTFKEPSSPASAVMKRFIQLEREVRKPVGLQDQNSYIFDDLP
jgi:hypothetical protein